MIQKKLSKTGLYILAVTLTCIVACSKNSNPGTEPPVAGYDQKALLTNMADNIIVPSYQQLSTGADDLISAAQAFSADANTTTLTNLQNQWKAAYKTWIKCEPFNFGPADGTVMLENNINYWPAKPDLINTELNGANALTDTYISGLGAQKKGFPAMEYLLFNRVNGNSAVLANFTTAAGAARRKEYVTALAGNISTNVKAVLAEWQNSYSATFKNNTGTALNSSLSLLLNNLIINLETSKNRRLGIPVGRKDNFTQVAADPNAVEAPYTDFAIEFLTDNAAVMNNIFQGKYGATDGQGFDDYAAALKADNNGELLYLSIEKQFTAYTNAVAAISPPLQNTVTANPAAVDVAWVESKKLLVLLKVDLSSNLGILITFSDNDGD